MESNFSRVCIPVQQPYVEYYSAGWCPQNVLSFDLRSRRDLILKYDIGYPKLILPIKLIFRN